MVISRPSAQQIAQILPPIPGHWRLARRALQIWHVTLTGFLYHRTCIYHQKMRRTDVYLKVELDLDPQESAERVAAEICRMIAKVYSVRKAEVSSIMPREQP